MLSATDRWVIHATPDKQVLPEVGTNITVTLSLNASHRKSVSVMSRLLFKVSTNRSKRATKFCCANLYFCVSIEQKDVRRTCS